MEKKKYEEPNSHVFELITENLVATSGDATGTIKPSPWGGNKRSSEEIIWKDEN